MNTPDVRARVIVANKAGDGLVVSQIFMVRPRVGLVQDRCVRMNALDATNDDGARPFARLADELLHLRHLPHSNCTMASSTRGVPLGWCDGTFVNPDTWNSSTSAGYSPQQLLQPQRSVR